MNKHVTAEDCLRPFDTAVLNAVSEATEADREGMHKVGHLANFVSARLTKYAPYLVAEDMQLAVMQSSVRLSDVGLIEENCAVTGKPHRKVPEAHFPDKPDIEELPELEQWLYKKLVHDNFSLAPDNAFAMLAEQLPPQIMHDLHYPVDELGRAWLRLSMNGYVGLQLIDAALTRAEQQVIGR